MHSFKKAQNVHLFAYAGMQMHNYPNPSYKRDSYDRNRTVFTF